MTDHRDARPARRTVRSLRIVPLLVAIVAAVVPGAAAPAAAAVLETPGGALGYFPVSTPALRSVTLTGATTQTLTVTGTGGVPSTGVSSVVVNVTVTNPNHQSSGVKLWAAGTTQPAAPMVRYTQNRTQSSLVTVKVGANGGVSLRSLATTSAQQTPVTLAVVGYHATQQNGYFGAYHNRFQPAASTTVHDGTGASGPAQPLGVGRPVAVQVTGVAGVPTTATAAVVRVTTMPPAGAADLEREVTVQPEGGSASSLLGWYTFPEDVRHSAVVTTALSSQGRITVNGVDSARNRAGAGLRSTMVVDVVGWFEGTTYKPANRLPRPAAIRPAMTMVHGQPVGYDVRTYDGMPNDASGLGMVAAVVDVTVSGATRAGSVSLGGGVDHVAFAAGQTITNKAIVPVGTDGRLQLTYRASNGTTADRATVKVDVVGWYAFNNLQSGRLANGLGDRFAPVAPTSVYDSGTARVAAGSTTTFPVVGGATGVPSTGVTRVALQVQAWNAAASTTLAVGPTAVATARAPQLAVGSGQQVSSTVIADVGPDGRVAVKAGSAATSFQAVVTGWYGPYTGEGPSSATLAVIGDSNTYLASEQVHARNEDRHQIALRGMSGHQARETRWWMHTIAASRPEYVIANLGTNDAYVGGSYQAADTRADVVALLQSVGGARCRYLVTLNANEGPPTDTAQNFRLRAWSINDQLSDVVDPASPTYSPGIGLIDWNLFVYYRQSEDLIQADGIHLSPLGQQRMAELYEAAIEYDPASPLAGFIRRC